MTDLKIKWVKKQGLKNSILIKGVPGVGSISQISVDYLVNKLKAKLVCKIYSNYLPNIVLINKESLLEQPYYSVYVKKLKKGKKLVFLKNSYPPTKEYYSHLSNQFLADFIKKIGVKEVITIAGIAYKQMPKKIKMHCAVTHKKLKKKLDKQGLVFDQNTKPMYPPASTIC
jgi:proteasome assembly chaperone (PAC2) family protein